MNIQKIFQVIEDSFDDTQLFDFDRVAHAAFRNGFKMNYGVSKICFMSRKSNWVIKVDRDQSGDCEREYRNYKKAQALGMGQAFLETHFLGYGPHNMQVYAQRKIDCTVAETPTFDYIRQAGKISPRIINEIRRSFFENSIEDCFWIGMLIVSYGEEFARKLAKFTCDNLINDLHQYNRGFLNGKPVIMDYSGVP